LKNVGKKTICEKGALEILRRIGCSKGVMEHCKAVSNLAVQIAKNAKNRQMIVNIKLIRFGALLHDLGRSKTHEIDHVIIGSEIAESLNLSKKIIKIIERHAGGGISNEEAEEMEWPPRQYIPETIEEKIVTYSDKLIKGIERISIEQTIKNLSQKLGSSHPSIERVKRLHEELSPLVNYY